LIELPFNDFELEYDTKKEAVLALSKGYRYLKEFKEDWDNSSASYSYGYILNYDAGSAKVE